MAAESPESQNNIEELAITANDDNISSNGAALDDSAEDAPTIDAHIIEQQQSTIDVLIAQTERLTKQINSLIANGAQITDNTTQNKPDSVTHANSDDSKTAYEQLLELGKEFGNNERRY